MTDKISPFTPNSFTRNGVTVVLDAEQQALDLHILQEFTTVEGAIGAGKPAQLDVVKKLFASFGKLPAIRAQHWAAEFRRVGILDEEKSGK